MAWNLQIESVSAFVAHVFFAYEAGFVMFCQEILI